MPVEWIPKKAVSFRQDCYSSSKYQVFCAFEHTIYSLTPTHTLRETERERESERARKSTISENDSTKFTAVRPWLEERRGDESVAQKC